MSSITTIRVLPQQLFLVSIPKADVPRLTHPLLQCMFFHNGDVEFVAYTETPDEVSMIVDGECARLLQRHIADDLAASGRSPPPAGRGPRIEAEPRRAFQFSLGSAPLETGVVNSITSPLGRAHISVFYFTTFNTDYILVEQSKFEAAKRVLKSNFRIVWLDDDDASGDSPSDSDLSAANAAQPPAPGTGTPEPGNIQQETFHQLRALSDKDLFLTSIRIDTVDEITRDLIKLIFFPESSDRFLSFTHTDEEISLIVDGRTLSTFPRHKLQIVLDNCWIAFRRVFKNGFGETGVVSTLAAPLVHIPILYLSSFCTSYFLVRQVDFQSAVSSLERAGFSVALPTPAAAATSSAASASGSAAAADSS